MIGRSRQLILSAMLTCCASGAMAHTVWLESMPQTQGDFQVLFGGHAGKLET